jgi:hypothetical protein
MYMEMSQEKYLQSYLKQTKMPFPPKKIPQGTGR